MKWMLLLQEHSIQDGQWLSHCRYLLSDVPLCMSMTENQGTVLIHLGSVMPGFLPIAGCSTPNVLTKETYNSGLVLNFRQVIITTRIISIKKLTRVYLGPLTNPFNPAMVERGSLLNSTVFII